MSFIALLTSSCLRFCILRRMVIIWFFFNLKVTSSSYDTILCWIISLLWFLLLGVILKSLLFWLLLLSPGAGRARTFELLDKFSIPWPFGVMTSMPPSMKLVYRYWFKHMVMNLRMNSWQMVSSMNLEQIMMNGTLEADALLTSLR